MKNLLYLLFVLPLLFSCGGASADVDHCACIDIANQLSYGVQPPNSDINKYDKCWEFYKNDLDNKEVSYLSLDATMLRIYAEKNCKK